MNKGLPAITDNCSRIAKVSCFFGNGTLVLLLEFQSTVDYLMALRCRTYVDNLHQENWRGRRFAATDRLPPVVVFVIYNGDSTWNAANRMIDLVNPGAADADPTADPTPRSPLLVGDGYLTVDSGRVGEDDSKWDNAAALLAALEHPTLDTAVALAERLYRHLAGADLRELRELLLGWLGRVGERRLEWNMGLDDMVALDRAYESDEMEAYFEERRRTFLKPYVEQGRQEGREEARSEERALLRRLAARRFGTDAAAPLVAFLAGIDDAEGLAVVGDWIVDCTTGAELLERIEAASAP